MPDKPAWAGTEVLEQLFEKAVAGDRDAQQEIITKYTEHCLYLIGKRRTRKTQAVWGLSDFIQQLRMKVYQYDFEDKHFASMNAYFAFLNQIVNNEVGQVERKQRRRGDTKSLETLSQKEDEQLVDSAPAPMVIHAAEDDWQRALAALTTPLQREVAELLRQGLAAHEIAARLNINERTVRRAEDSLEARSAGSGVVLSST